MEKWCFFLNYTTLKVGIQIRILSIKLIHSLFILPVPK